MSKLNDLKREIADYLRAADGFLDTEVLTAYPGRARAYPLPRAAVAVGIDGMELAPVGLGGYLGESGTESLFGGNAGITLRFDLYCPGKEDGGRLHELYEALCGALMADRNPFGLTKLACGEISYDASSSAHRLTARGTLSAALLRGEDEERFRAAQIMRRSESNDNR